MDNGFELNPKDVVSMSEDDTPLNGSTFKAGQLTFHLADRTINDDYVEAWISSGVKCEVLREGEPWRKGKVRISLHFIPDESSSPLADLRSDLDI